MIISPSLFTYRNPKRIISLVPSITELLFDLGLEEETVGITKFCVRPEEWFRSKTRVGGTKNADLEKITALQPELILCNKEENTREQVEALAALFPVYLSDINTFDDALQMIKDVGALTAKAPQADVVAKKISAQFVSALFSPEHIRTAYLIWKDPYMAAGGDTFISSMMQKAGFENIFAAETRYPQADLKDIAMRNPELVLLSSEPYPFKEKHIAAVKTIMPDAEIMLADGEMFSWYGSRMLLSASYFDTLKRKVIRPKQ